MEYLRLENQPLQFVLAEFRFSPVMNMKDYIPEFQDRLRKIYPIPEIRTDRAVQVQPQGVQFQDIERWSFLTPDRRQAVELNQERLIFITADYQRYPRFQEACKYAIDSLIAVVEPTLLSRIGLRYGDLVLVDENEQIAELINSELIPPTSMNELGELDQCSNELTFMTQIGRLMIRTLYGNNNLTCMPDVQGLPVQLSTNTELSERMLLDFDHIWDNQGQPVSFESEKVTTILASLHDLSRKAFWRATSDYARNIKWK